GGRGIEIAALARARPEVFQAPPSALLHVGFDSRRLRVDAERDDGHPALPGVALLAAQRDQLRHGFLAWAAPGGPEFQEDHLAAQAAEPDRLPGGQARQV